jgi:uncharacterized protein YpmB
MGKKTTITLIIIIAILIIATWVFTSTYQSAREQYLDGQEKSKQLAIEKGNLSEIEEIDTFYGQMKYHVISGVNKQDEKVFVWIPQTKKNQDVIIKKRSSGITEKQAIAKVSQENNPVEIIEVNLGMDEGIPIWEVKYIDESDRYTFDFVNFYDGEIVKHMAIKDE